MNTSSKKQKTKNGVGKTWDDLNNPPPISSSDIRYGCLTTNRSAELKGRIDGNGKNVKPSKHGRNKGSPKITFENRVKLVLLTLDYGNQWVKIKAWFPGMTDNKIKNQYFNITRKVIRKVFRGLQLKPMSSLILKIKPSLLGQFFLKYCHHMTTTGNEDFKKSIIDLMSFAYDKSGGTDISKFNLNRQILKSTLIDIIEHQYSY